MFFNFVCVYLFMAPETVDTIISGGTVVTPDGTVDATIAIDGEKITAVGDESSLPDGQKHIDASGKLIMPGMIDPHVHAHDDPFTIDSYETATKAAALGGITTLINFAWEGWDDEVSIYDPDATMLDGIERQRAGNSEAVIDYGVHATIATEDQANLELLEDVVEAGASSIKMFTAYGHGISNGFVNKVLQRLADLGAVGVFHTEDPTVCDQLTEQFQAEEKGTPEWYPKSRPDYAEAMAADNAARMAQEAGAKYYGVHTSCRKAADVLEQYQDDGTLIRAETCTHYTVHDDSVYEELGNLPLIAPPIRSPDDIEAMFDHLRSGVLSVVSTDHCAYKKESKNVENWWDCAAFGANALQRSLPVFHDEAVNNRNIPYPNIVKYMSTNPAKTFGMPEKGTLDPGTDADIIIFDPEASETISADDNASNADFTIYEGREVTGQVEKTFVRGTLVADQGEIVASPGHGEFLEREVPDWQT